MILVISSENSYASKRLLEEAGVMSHELRVMSVSELAKKSFNINVSQYKALYVRNPYLKGSAKYLPQIVKLAKKFKAAGKKVVDANIAKGELGKGKWVDYQKLMEAGLPIPKTSAFPSQPLPPQSYVLKWQYGMGGKNVFLIQNKNQLKTILPLHPKKEWLVQEFIWADYEYKVVTVGYKALPVIVRFNIKRGGLRLDYDKYKVIKSPSAKKIAAIAQKAAKVLGRELAKVDILEKNGRFYILEVNRFPGMESFEELTRYNAVKKFIKYLGR